MQLVHVSEIAKTFSAFPGFHKQGFPRLALRRCEKKNANSRPFPLEIYLLTVNPASDVLMPACQDMLNQHAQQPKICTLFQESFKFTDMDQDQTEKMKTSGTLAFGERKFRSR